MNFPRDLNLMPGTPFYDRYGMPISFERFAALKLHDGERNDVVATTEYGDYWISTVWLGWVEGLDAHGCSMIFETAVFRRGRNPIFTARYPTEGEAAAGHLVVVGAMRIAHPLPALPPARPN